MHQSSRSTTLFSNIQKTLGLDLILLTELIILSLFGLLVLYSATSQNSDKVSRQVIHFALAFFTLFIFSRISPELYRLCTPWMFLLSLVLITLVLFHGITIKGAQRWLKIGFLQFQPSELFRLLVPMSLAWHLHSRLLPPTFFESLAVIGLTLIPSVLIARQPDLGTALLTLSSGGIVMLLSGIRPRNITMSILLFALLLPLGWTHLHTYQKNRIITFFNPERDPLNLGYHIIQSKTAIGSGGLFGKGWLKGTQSQLRFLPETDTDFIFAVCCEELGFLGAIALLGLYLGITFRGLVISMNAQDTFSRLLAGTLSLNFFITAFVNMGMVMGILPVVGIPLPFVSYGGTALILWGASFGIVMAIQNHTDTLHLDSFK